MATATKIPLASVTLSAATSAVTLGSISQSYRDLILVINAKGSSASNLRLQFNGDTGNNYSRTVLYGTGSSAGSGRVSNFASIAIDAYGALDTSNFNYNSITNIQSYSYANSYKGTLTRANNSATGTDLTAGLWSNASAITRITVFTNDGGNFASGSTFNLYGIA